MDDCLSSNDKRASLLSYWIKDYVRMLRSENAANCPAYLRYKRGSVVKVHLGFRIGNEEGGLHYAIVLNKSDSARNAILTVLPLTSVKPNTDVERIHPNRLYLGTALLDSVYDKLQQSSARLLQELARLNDEWTQLKNKEGVEALDVLAMEKELKRVGVKNKLINKQLAEVSKMKSGSIALVDQVVTISKLRIYDPRFSQDMLFGIRLNDDMMNKIDDKIRDLFLG